MGWSGSIRTEAAFGAQGMNRRSFLEVLTGMPILKGAAQRLEAQRKAAADPLDRIGVSTWSLHKFFAATRGKDVPDSALLKLTDFFKLAHDRWGVRHFEVVNVHFDSTDPGYVAEIKRLVTAVGGRIHNIPTDLRGTNLSDEDEQKRLATVAAVKKWMDVAAAVGSPSLRPNTGQARDENNLEPAMRSFRELA